VGSATQTVTKKRYYESSEVVVRYFIEITLTSNITYKTSQPVNANEYLALVSPGDHVTISPNTYVVTDTEFVKNDNGALLSRVNWRVAD
jgi:hypothetical protein